MRFGIAVLPAGKRRDTLFSSLEQQILSLFAGRILLFDEQASQAYVTLRARARTAGQVIATVDGYSAAIAVTHGFAVATRDTSPFEAVGLKVINPWTWMAH